MPRLTLRTLLAYIDDTLDPDQARALGRKVAESAEAKQLIERIKKVTRRRRLHAPVPDGTEDDISDPNTVAEYLSDNLDPDQLKPFESACLESDVHLAEVAACHQILTLVMTEPVRVPPSANQRMYKLVEPPASDPRRKPGKGMPVAGATPPAAEAEDDHDAALLLGMKRYTAADSWAGRLGLLGAVAAITLLLAGAVLMALPHTQPSPPDSSRNVSYAMATVPATGSPAGTPATEPKAGEPKSDPKTEPKIEPKAEPKTEPKVEPVGGPGLGDPPQAPREGRDVIGKLETPNVLVATRAPDAATWTRVDQTDPVLASEPVMALPGYKADVRLNSDVVVHLWGHVPDQVPIDDLNTVMTRLRVLESRVRFHPPAPGFDADLTLDAGRIYLTTRKPGGAKVRVRFATEVWDVALPNDKSEVMVQTNSAYTPGTPLARGQGGSKPRADARLAVTRGSAGFTASSRFKKFDTLAAGSEITWDSKTNVLSGPKPFPKEDPTTIRIPLIEGEQGKVIQKALSDTATRLMNKDGVRVLLEGRMNTLDVPIKATPTPFEIAVAVNAVRFAILGYAAIADGPDAPALVGNLYDQLANTDRDFARQAAVMAVSAWVGRDPGNTAILIGVMTGKKRLPEDEAEHIAQLLRGFSSETSGDTGAVDALVKDLDDANIVIREAALANLIAFFDPESLRIPALRLNAGAYGQPAYDAAVKKWRERGEEIKKRMIERKEKK